VRHFITMSFEQELRPCVEHALSLSDVFKTPESHDADGQVAQSYHSIGSISCSNSRTVLTKRFVSNIVEFILYGPFVPKELHDILR